ncbi:CG11672, partial [Drosophila busckii]
NMSKTIGMWSLSLLLLAGTIIKSNAQIEIYESTETITDTETTTEALLGPIGLVADNFASMAVDAGAIGTTQLEEAVQRLLSELQRNIVNINSLGMAQLNQQIDQTNQVFLGNPDCNPAWNVIDFTEDVSRQLNVCTAPLDNSILLLRDNGRSMLNTAQSFVEQISQLPALCQGSDMSPLNFAFMGGSNCILEGMSRLNQGLAQAMHNVSLLVSRIRHVAQQQLSQAEQCSELVVTQMSNALYSQRVNC